MPPTPLPADLSVTLSRVVEPPDTARALGSGDLDVLGTPRLLAWMEAATCKALAPHLSADETSVGTRATLEHLGASAVGARVELAVSLVYNDGRLVRFEAIATEPAASDSPDAAERMVGRAEITRVIVDRTRFLARLPTHPV